VVLLTHARRPIIPHDSFLQCSNASFNCVSKQATALPNLPFAASASLWNRFARVWPSWISRCNSAFTLVSDLSFRRDRGVAILPPEFQASLEPSAVLYGLPLETKPCFLPLRPAAGPGPAKRVRVAPVQRQTIRRRLAEPRPALMECIPSRTLHLSEVFSF